jgi:hypothetical protein
MEHQETKPRRVFLTLVVSFFIISWVILCLGNIFFIDKSIRATAFGPLDVAKRLTSPDRSKTAILARSYLTLMDLNFILFITDADLADLHHPDNAAHMYVADGIWQKMAGADGKQYLWLSHDYEKTTGRDWHEDVIWSEDSTVIGVRVDGDFVYAYDFKTKNSYQDQQQIEELLASR